LEWFKWRLITAKICTLQEFDSHYSYLDMIQANEALDIQIEMENESMKDINKK
jgi:hypothetical protein